MLSCEDFAALPLPPSLEEDLLRWRRYVHQHPELSEAECGTAAYVEAALRAMGIDEVSAPTPTSRTAYIRGLGSAGTGRTVALRADMDALPVPEATGLPFASENPGVSHACGHDGHVAILLGAAAALQALRGEFSGSVKLIFQHAEEVAPGGARELVEKGVMEGVDAAVGLHIMTDPVGMIRVCTDLAASTASDCCWIDIEGCGSHASMPQASVDPVMIGAEIVTALQTIVSRSISPDHFAVVSPTVFSGGEVINAIPQRARIGVNIRTKDPADREKTRERTEALARGIAQANGASAEVEWLEGCPAIIQDPAMIERAMRVAQAVQPEGLAAAGHGMFASEDFSFLAEKAPSVYVILGGGTPEEGYPYKNHHPAFRFDERCLIAGVRFETAMALDLLMNP